MNGDDWTLPALAELTSSGLRRRCRSAARPGGIILEDGTNILNFSSNDYLDLARDPRCIEAAVEAVRTLGAGSGASRLMTGTLPLHQRLEAELASHKGYPAALLFGSGFLANVGVIAALVGRGDTVVADRLCHASIVDGAILSRANLRRFRHNDPDDLAAILDRAPAAGRRLVVTESIFSMDGDRAPLPELARTAAEARAMLLVDEAHATGIFGPAGSGLVREAGLEAKVTVCMGTLSKALGSYGGYVACSESMRSWFVNEARSFIYTTALPPAAAGAALAALRILELEPERGPELLRRADRLRTRLREAGFDPGTSCGPIIPVPVGANEKAVALSERLRAAGLLAVAIRPPTVPAGTARLRLSVSLAHTNEMVDRAADLIRDAAKAEGLL